MKVYTKPNMELPISLHDSRVTKIIVQPSTSEMMDGVLILEFDNGYFKVDDKNDY